MPTPCVLTGSLTCTSIGAALLVLLHGPLLSRAQQADETSTVAMHPGAIAVEISFGLRDREPTDWDGGLNLSMGRVVHLAFPQIAGKADGNRWTICSQPAARGSQDRPRQGAAPRRAATVRLTLEAPRSATAEVTTPQGRFSFVPGELTYGQPVEQLDGAVSVLRIPQTQAVTHAAGDEDYPATAVAPDGTIWCAYVAYQHGTEVSTAEADRGRFESLLTRGHGDQVRLCQFSAGTWSSAGDVSEPGLDVWRPCVAVDRDGTVWTFWSQQVDGNWDLYGRSFDPASRTFGRVRWLTTERGADINVVATGQGTPGDVWLAWQGWREGNFDILLAPLTSDGPLIETRVSNSSANDWNPAIAAVSWKSKNPRFWVGWDTYHKGDYDVHVRCCNDGSLEESIAVADSARFEARPSLAVDRNERLWVAYEEAGENWGKDYGDRWPGRKGVPFYVARQVRVRRVDDQRLQQPKGLLATEPIATAFDDKRIETRYEQRNNQPRLGLDGEGRVWLLFRRHPLTSGSGERWVSFATVCDGAEWTTPRMLSDSDNLLDNRPALAPSPGGGLMAVYSTDRRTQGSASAGTNDLMAALLEVESSIRQPVFVPVADKEDSPAEPIHPDETEQVERIRSYRITVGDKTYRLLRGEFHRHTEISAHRDWDGPLEEIWRYGLDVASMDWIGPGDHDYGVGLQYLWWLTQKQIDLYHHAPAFMPMFTYERSMSYPSGHRNVMFDRRGIRTLPRLTGGRPVLYGTPEQGSPDVQNLYSYLKFFGGICSSHTSATSMGTDWRDHDPTVEPVVEIFQGHRQNYEETLAPLAARNEDDSIQGYRPDGFVWHALAKGHRLGFQASSDHVSTHISYAVVLAEEATRSGILAAFKKRHSYAAHDNIIMDVRSGDHLMGDEFTVKTPPQLEITVIGTDKIAQLDIVRQSGSELPQYVYTISPKEEKVRLRWTDKDAQPGATIMYYVRIQQVDHKLAWASPMWIHFEP